MPGSNSSAPLSRAAALPPETPSPLAMTVHEVSVPDPAAEPATRRTALGRAKMLLVLLVCAAPVVASYLTYFVIRPQGRTNYSTLILPTRSMPALTLATLAGRPVDAASLRSQWLLVAVGPSACDKACEQRLYMQRQLREMLGRERDRLDKLWLVTDAGTPAAALRAVIETPGMQVLRADAKQLSTWLAPEAGQPLDAHLYVVDPMGEWMMRVPVGAEPARVKRDLERLLRASGSWDQPGR
jgi:hypothetical protein